MGSNKTITTIRTINLPAGKINAATIGKDLAPTGINLVYFVTQYNEQTKKDVGSIIPAKITIYDDRSFTFTLKTPPTAFLIKKIAGIKKGASKSGQEVVGELNQDQLEQIAKIKLPDMNASDIDGAVSMVMGTAKNMGIRIVD